MPTNEKEMAFTFNILFKKGYSGILVGKCLQFPNIIVQGATLHHLTKTMTSALEGYFNTFPEEGQKAMELYSVEIKNEEQQAEVEKKIQKQLERQQQLQDEIEQEALSQGWQKEVLNEPMTIKTK